MLLPILRDIVRFTSLNFIETLKITGTEEETKVESMSIKESVVLKARLNEPEPELQGVFGMNNLPVLKGFVEFPSFRDESAKVTIERRERQGEQVPSMIRFVGDQGQIWTYRLMGKEIVPDQPIQIAINWDLSIVPTKSKIEEFAKLASILSGIHKDFTPSIRDGNLCFHIGDGHAMHDGFVIFAENVDGRLRGQPSWSIATLMAILKLAEQADKAEMRIDSDGLLGVTMNSGIAEYTYLIAGKIPH